MANHIMKILNILFFLLLSSFYCYSQIVKTTIEKCDCIEPGSLSIKKMSDYERIFFPPQFVGNFKSFIEKNSFISEFADTINCNSFTLAFSIDETGNLLSDSIRIYHQNKKDIIKSTSFFESLPQWIPAEIMDKYGNIKNIKSKVFIDIVVKNKENKRIINASNVIYYEHIEDDDEFILCLSDIFFNPKEIQALKKKQ